MMHMSLEDTFIEAIKAGETDKVGDMLIQNPELASARNAQGESAVLQAKYRGRDNILQMLLGLDPKLTVYEATVVGDIAAVRRDIAADPGIINRLAPDGFNLLGLAAFFSHPDIVDLLLENGAEVNVAAANPMKVTAMHAAASSRQTGIIAKLLARGADPNVRQHGNWTPLHQAAAQGLEDMVRLLLKHGADPTIIADSQETAKDMAVAKGHPGVAALL
jgi:ankyrin repeat protein